MLRLFIWLILFAFAEGYDQTQLNMNAKVFEKILLLDANLGEKSTKNGGIGITIVYDEAELLDAQRLQRFLETTAVEGNFPHPLTVKLARYGDFKNQRADAYFLLDSPDAAQVRAVAAHAIANGIITFSFNYSYLEHGVMLSLRIDQKVYPVLNPEAIRESRINFKPILIRIAKQYNR